MDLLMLAIALGIGLVVSVRPRRIRLVFRCHSCGTAIECSTENVRVEEFDPTKLPIGMGWRLGPDGSWACRAHADVEAR